jgi:adenylyltransferase/sulfurtransferase
LIDRDIVEESNLPRQTLYDEHDAENALPKAEAASRHLKAIDRRASITAHAEDLNPLNAARLLSGTDLIIDGLDNLETRYLVNDFAVRERVPWVYAGAIGQTGMIFPIRPKESACLRCLFPDPPNPTVMETCDTAGVLSPLPTLVASLQVAEALKLLTGAFDKLLSRTLHVELWDGSLRSGVVLTRQPGCPCCEALHFPFLEARVASTTSLCGRDVVQVRPEREGFNDLQDLADRLRKILPVQTHQGFLRFSTEGIEFTVFLGGRALLRGTNDLKRARSLYARYVGS